MTSNMIGSTSSKMTDQQQRNMNLHTQGSQHTGTTQVTHARSGEGCNNQQQQPHHLPRDNYPSHQPGTMGTYPNQQNQMVENSSEVFLASSSSGFRGSNSNNNRGLRQMVSLPYHDNMAPNNFAPGNSNRAVELNNHGARSGSSPSRHQHQPSQNS